MSSAPSPQDAEVLKRLLAARQYSAEAAADKALAVYRELLRQSPRVRAGDFGELAAPDLALLFDLYDGRVFDGGLQRLLDAEAAPLLFRTSRRLTRTAGTTTRFQPRRPRPGAPPLPARYEIAISTPLLFQTFADVRRPVRVNGLLCRDRVEALQRIFEHELMHLLEMLIWTRSSCSAPRFAGLAWNYFGHTATKHDLVTQDERASHRFGLQVGDRVAFLFDGERRIGIVRRITRRATILVESAAGARYSDGKRYEKFYVPLGQLSKLPA